MTISSENVQNQYNGNDSTTVFAYSYKINNQAHLSVVVADADGNETTLTISTHYTVSGVGAAGGGNVTTTDLTSICGQVTLPTGWNITITRDVPLLQETDFDNQGGFYAQTHEDAFDYITMIVQQLQEQLDRCPKVSISSGDTGDDYLTTIDAAVTAAQAAQTAAETAETNAETAETNAAASAAAASTSETNAATSASNASTSETNAAASAAAASTSETNAATSASNASTSETNAGTSETNAAASAAAASTSETNAATSASNASTSETNAAASAAAAATSETNAATSETNAAASAATIPTIAGGDATKIIKINAAETAYEKTNAKITADNALDLPEQSSTPSAPSSGRMLFYPKNDKRAYYQNSDGGEVAIGTGSGETDFLALKTISSFNSYDDGAVSQPVDGTGGSPAAVSVAKETSSPIDTDATSLNLKISKTAADGQGEGISVDFTTRGQIDYAKPQVITVEIKSSANYVDDDFGIYIYDKDNSTLITPADPDVKASTLVSKQIFEFQTAPDADDYRLIFHCKTTNANAYDLTCTVKVGPAKKILGTPVTDWESYTPSFTNFTLGSGTADFYWKRVGDSVHIYGFIALSSSTMGSGPTFSLPSGLSVDSSKKNSTQNVGYAYLLDLDTTANRDGAHVRATGTTMYVVAEGGGGLTSSSPFTWADGDNINFYAIIPIAGWGSNVTMANMDSNRAVVFKAYLSSNQTITTQGGAGEQIDIDTVVFDSHAGFDATNKYYVIPESGYYFCRGHVFSTSITTKMYAVIHLNGVVLTDESLGSGSDERSEVSTLLYLVKGDTIGLGIWQNESTSETVVGGSDKHDTNLSIHKINSCSQIGSNEKVFCSYSSNTSGSIGTGETDQVFEDKSTDTHNAYNASTGEFTVPYSDVYTFKSVIETNATSYSVGHALSMYLNVDGSKVAQDYVRVQAAGSHALQGRIEESLYLTKGQVVKITADSNVSTTRTTGSTRNRLTIKN